LRTPIRTYLNKNPKRNPVKNKVNTPVPVSTRREFCAQALTLVTVGSILQACGGGSPTSPNGGSASALPLVNGSVANGQVTVTVDSSSPLSAVGSAAFVQSSGGSFLVAHVGQDAFTALTSMCTHQACTITGFQNGSYVCPCHGSRFSTSGAVQNGPAAASLHQFPTQYANGVLTIG
jgi:cytochrome b6-f complex iron-sulfur subunit